MTEKIIMDGCECVCSTARIVTEQIQKSSVYRTLEIGLIVLIVILVIIGLIIRFNKLKGGEDERENSGNS